MRVPSSAAEIARARMLALEPHGFEECEADDGLELTAYTDVAGEQRLRDAFGFAVSAPLEPGWEDRWRSFHRPVIAGGLWIGPPWTERAAGRPAVVIEPGRAFGTGAHPTTRACIELLAGLDRGSVLDAGCGSGVLTIAASRLGFAPVVAVDLDPVAVDLTRENARRNDVQIDASVADVLHDPLPSVDVLVANIELPTVEGLLRRRPAARAITSGYLAQDRPNAGGWRPETHVVLEGWAADLFRSV